MSKTTRINLNNTNSKSMSGFGLESQRSHINTELLQSMINKNRYLNEIIAQLHYKIKALEDKIIVLEKENINLKQKVSIKTPEKETVEAHNKRFSRISPLFISQIEEPIKVNSSVVSTDHKTSKKIVLPSPMLLSPTKRKNSSEELIDTQTYNNQKPLEKSTKYYEDIGNSIVAPLYITSLMKKLPPNTNNIESDPEEINFNENSKKSQVNIGPLTFTHKESAMNEITVLNFIKSPIHLSPYRRKSKMVTTPQSNFDDFGGRIKLFNIQSEKAQGAERLFEDFFVIGLDKTELKPGLQQVVSPKIIYSPGYCNVKDENECSWKRVIQDFAFPFGIKAKYLRKLSKINKILFSCDMNEKNERTFIFLLQSGKAAQKFDSSKTVLGLSNPNKILYGICFVTEDFCVLSDDSINHYWSFPKAVCFVTFYPFIKLFIDVIFNVLNVVKARRLSQYLQNMKPGENVLHTLDIEYFLKELSFESNILLNTLYKHGLENPLAFDSILKFQYQSNCISFNIPKQEKLYYLETLWGSFLTFSTLSFDDFIFILCAILLETPICFLSSNLCLLTSTILTFYGLLKPFKWPHPIIFPLPESLFTLLDSPVPIIFGLNQNLEFVKQNSFDFTYKNIIFVGLDENYLIIDRELLKELGLSIPHFNNFKATFRPLYEKLNNKLSGNFPQAKKSPKKGYLPTKRKTVKTERKPLIYTASENEDEVCRKIVEIVFEVLSNNIVKKIPKNTEYEEIEKKMLKDVKSQEDLRFLRRFLKTQMFCYYIEGGVAYNGL